MRAATEWELWTTTARVVLDHRDRRHLAAAEACVRAVTDAVDLACSRFREDSELVARTADLERGTEVSPLLATLVHQALDAARLSDGDVDPTLGHRMVSLGYDAAFASTAGGTGAPLAPTSRTADALDPRPAWQRILLSGTFLRIPAGVRLDLGATAKAAAADMAAASITARLGVGALVSLGGDVATAGPDPSGGWQVRVQDLDTDPADHVRIASGWSVATSSTQKRRWEQDGRARHHILDPRWGLPAEPVWRSVTVVAPSCVTANTMSTAAIVRGRAAPAMLRASGRAARLVSASGEVVRLGGWPADDASDAAGRAA
ncbi:thiamine biosynthesis lipoprotein [Curtobacterium luteum]|uniref:FAD:protein FMN transferase n=1 Tax=Curtobacterium luteum TaxID=33881 RepID=A0A8H9GBD9_9MICO|nr:FAD:protein FMN transferase [Curtobacterium luteum]MBM7801008.1 thiamine biosynthesis lipoprotein [Curtobacterium luteum]NUU50933.1 FAD:protein FMN transferase [Curtobacterium luteum]GGL06123.1 FAD:protein FMN transferase [Curtobacterium luteum]